MAVARSHDLRLCHAILRDTELINGEPELRTHREWDAAPVVEVAAVPAVPALFDWDGGIVTPGIPHGVDDALAEFARQRAAIDSSAEAGRLRLLCAAESAGALIAVELRAAGLPWDVEEHERLLVEQLGARPLAGGRPERMTQLADDIRDALGDPKANPDSPPQLLRSLHRVGLAVESTSRWELRELEHPVIEPLLTYKKLARLYSANGWAWLAEWVHDRRFRPVYVPAGVVTGRWASSGGGALQIPRMLRRAVRADPGWLFVTADVAQLEPRVLAAMAGDLALADAARGGDLYAGIVDAGAVGTRAEAKVALLGAMYGATTGDSGRLLPGLRRAYPRAMRLVDDAARTGERGGVVHTWLGRTAPPPGGRWHAVRAAAAEPDASRADVDRARRQAADRGRFTRNFVVQGTAAEWALAWLGDLRARLAAFPPVPESEPAAEASGVRFARVPHLAFFLHDELIVHTPAASAPKVAAAVQDAADAAARLLFGTFPLDFRLDVKIGETAEKE
ncbi:3'-5' exonuclease [Microbacterium mangrovi]|uniref:DNA-directed DNA polymerase n=1 Tax=Microbacterium mangrovi TaxID=1348253 RepID=A0A0B2A6Y0_9MICO|nr:3'-5' exonuclease [Microbacterium mangrovi]